MYARVDTCVCMCMCICAYVYVCFCMCVCMYMYVYRYYVCLGISSLIIPIKEICIPRRILLTPRRERNVVIVLCPS